MTKTEGTTVSILEREDFQFGYAGLRSDGIFIISINPNVVMGKAEMMMVHSAKKRMGKGNKIPNLVLMGKYSTADTEGRAFSASPEGSVYRIADAFVIHSLAQRIILIFI